MIVLDSLSKEWVDGIARGHRERHHPGFTTMKEQHRLCPFRHGTAHHERWWWIYLGQDL